MHLAYVRMSYVSRVFSLYMTGSVIRELRYKKFDGPMHIVLPNCMVIIS